MGLETVVEVGGFFLLMLLCELELVRGILNIHLFEVQA